MNHLTPSRRGPLQRPGSAHSALPVSRLHGDWNRIFDHLLSDAWTPVRGAAKHAPAVDVFENEHLIRVKAEVPGVDPEALEISLTGDVLTISGSKLEESEAEQDDRSWSERSFGAFQRTLQLPGTVDGSKVEAEHENGVVTITLHKADTARPTRIKVSTK